LDKKSPVSEARGIPSSSYLSSLSIPQAFAGRRLLQTKAPLGRERGMSFEESTGSVYSRVLNPLKSA